MALILDRAIYLKANDLNKTLDQAIVDGDFSGGGGGGGLIEVFNFPVILGSSAQSLTGLAYFRAPSSLNLKNAFLQVWEMNSISSGLLEIDIKKGITPDDSTMVSIFSTLPQIDFSLASDYETSSGVKATSSVANGNWLRLDVSSIPSGWLGKFSVTLYAE
jgi:hypothetical protein